MATDDVDALSAIKRALLEQRMSGRAGLPSPISGAMGRRPRPGPAPLSPLQEQIFYFSRLEPSDLVYNEAATIRKDGPLDVGSLRVAFAELVQRHEILRSTFELVDGEPVQVVDRAPKSELAVLDLSGMPAAEREGEAVRVSTAQAKRPYDLARGPLIRGLLIRFTPDHHRLYLALHQLVFDCVSLSRVILPELVWLYGDASAGREPSLTERPLQYSDYAVWLRERALGTDFRQRIDYWRHHLGAPPTVRLPLDRPRPAQPRFDGAIERLVITGELADQLWSVARAHGATLFHVLSAAFSVFLHRLSGQDEIVFGTLGDLRDRPELENLVGYCVTPLVVCADVGDDPAFSDLVRRLRGDLLAGLSHLVPFDQLVRELRPRREPGANPIFQAALVMQPPAAAGDPAWSLTQVEPEAGDAVNNAKFDLTLELDDRPAGGFDGRLIYRADLFSAETAVHMSHAWAALLGEIAAAPSARVSELARLTGSAPQRNPAAGADLELGGAAPRSAAGERPTGFAAPSTTLERQLASIWARLLRVDRVGAHDDFFELGGDSLLAMRLLVEVERRLGDQIPLAAFVQGSVTIAGLAATVEETRREQACRRSTQGDGPSGAAPRGEAIPIQPHGSLPILFFALADERSLLTLRHFTGPLGPDQPVLGLLPDRVDRRFDRSRSVTDLAATMLATVREAQPHGPYFLAGYSLGGMFAYEIAGQLRAAGEPVAWLGLLDTCTAPLVGRRWRLRQRAVRGWKAGPRSALLKLEGVARREITARLVRLRIREPKLSDAFDHRGALMLATSHACVGHDAPIDLFATDDTIAGAGSDSLGWSDVHRGQLQIHRMGGDHQSMFDTRHVDVLSAMVARSARDALHTTEPPDRPRPTPQQLTRRHGQ